MDLENVIIVKHMSASHLDQGDGRPDVLVAKLQLGSPCSTMVDPLTDVDNDFFFFWAPIRPCFIEPEVIPIIAIQLYTYNSNSVYTRLGARGGSDVSS